MVKDVDSSMLLLMLPVDDVLMAGFHSRSRCGSGESRCESGVRWSVRGGWMQFPCCSDSAVLPVSPAQPIVPPPASTLAHAAPLSTRTSNITPAR